MCLEVNVVRKGSTESTNDQLVLSHGFIACPCASIRRVRAKYDLLSSTCGSKSATFARAASIQGTVSRHINKVLEMMLKQFLYRHGLCSQRCKGFPILHLKVSGNSDSCTTLVVDHWFVRCHKNFKYGQIKLPP
jgi:hypothetical protein